MWKIPSISHAVHVQFKLSSNFLQPDADAPLGTKHHKVIAAIPNWYLGLEGDWQGTGETPLHSKDLAPGAFSASYSDE